ncbi:MAG TPA: polysaccharide deacetylase family protein [Spirochaetota bacterium]|nr:polysaccharide deacetylase family protein [Spirochaetota bacterium]
MISACIIFAHAPDSGLSGLSARPAPEKICALTFDDGPDARMTPLILDKLAKHSVIATFFVIGQLINDDTEPVIVRAVRTGCEIQNHSWGWDSMSAMPADEIKESVDRTTEAITKYAGKAPSFFRPPNLAVSDTMYETIDLAFAGGVVAHDWKGCNTSAEDRAKEVLGGVRDGAIILLHDVQPQPHPTPEALDIIIPELKKRGYRFVTISELFKSKGIKPEPHDKKLWTFAE